jgi:hypothetical protein
MSYFLNLFSPETWEAFRGHGADISGFRPRQRRTAIERVKQGDIFLCYLVRLSRWCGVLEVASQAFIDESVIFADPDPFVVRFKVGPRIILDIEHAIPVEDDAVWPNLSLTRNIQKGSIGWGAIFQGSLRRIPDSDGDFLVRILKQQDKERHSYPLTPKDLQRLAEKQSVRALDRTVYVEVPDDEEADAAGAGEPPDAIRLSHKIQATIVQIGVEMGFKIWVPRSDRSAIFDLLSSEARENLLDVLPLNYDDPTLKTIEQIDVIWLRKRSISRAFEVEHTTAIYSGLLRMADLLALQPNMDIRLHIVAPDERRLKVMREIKRPVFSLLERGPLYEHCSYVPYSAVNAIAQLDHLSNMKESILDEYEEVAEDE